MRFVDNPLEHKLGATLNLQHWVQNVPTGDEEKDNRNGKKEAFKIWGYPNWAFVKSTKRSGKNTSTIDRGDKYSKWKSIVIPYVVGVSEKLGRIFSKYLIPVNSEAKVNVPQGQNTQK